jgi:hypothetical protein
MNTFNQTNSKFIIIVNPEINSEFNPEQLIGELNIGKYFRTEYKFKLNEIPNFDFRGMKVFLSTFLGIESGHIIIKETKSVSFGQNQYFNSIFDLYPNCRLIDVGSLGKEDVSGTILRIYESNKLIFSLRAYYDGTLDEIFDLQEKHFNRGQQQKGSPLDKQETYSRALKIIEAETGISNLADVVLNQYNQFNFNELNLDDKYAKAIRRNLPNVNNQEVSSAWAGRELRAMLPEEKKELFFPTMDELKIRFANIFTELIEDNGYKFLKGHKLLKKKTKETEIMIMFGGVKGSMDISISKRFLAIEKAIQKFFKSNNLGEYSKKLSIYQKVYDTFRGYISFDSYESLATQLYWRVKYFFEKILPHFDSLDEIEKLNEKVNYGKNGSDCFSGYRKHKSKDAPHFENAFVAILSHDQNTESIVDKEVIDYIEGNEEKEKIRKKLKEYGA